MKPFKRILAAGLLAGIAVGLFLTAALWSIDSSAQKLTLYSHILGENRPVKIYLPPEYTEDTAKHYPVVYTVDGERIRNSAYAVMVGRMVTDKDFILVAIDMIGKRTRDLRREGARAFGTDTSGQAGLFLKFIETELIPHIAASYRSSGERILAGHSYGGMFTVHTMTARPELFEGYLAFSPALNADDRSLPELAVFLKTAEARSKSLFMNLGWETIHEYDVRFEEAVSLIQKNMPDGFHFEHNRYWLIHGAVPLAGYVDGFDFYFDGSASK